MKVSHWGFDKNGDNVVVTKEEKSTKKPIEKCYQEHSRGKNKGLSIPHFDEV